MRNVRNRCGFLCMNRSRMFSSDTPRSREARLGNLLHYSRLWVMGLAGQPDAWPGARDAGVDNQDLVVHLGNTAASQQVDQSLDALRRCWSYRKHVHSPQHLATIIPTSSRIVMSTETWTSNRVQRPCFNLVALSGSSQPSHKVKQGKVSEGLGVEVEEVQIVLATHLPDAVYTTRQPSSPWDSLHVPGTFSQRTSRTSPTRTKQKQSKSQVASPPSPRHHTSQMGNMSTVRCRTSPAKP